MANSSKFTRSWPRKCIEKGPNGLPILPPPPIMNFPLSPLMMKEEGKHMTSRFDFLSHEYMTSRGRLSNDLARNVGNECHRAQKCKLSKQVWPKHVFVSGKQDERRCPCQREILFSVFTMQISSILCRTWSGTSSKYYGPKREWHHRSKQKARLHFTCFTLINWLLFCTTVMVHAK